MVTVNQPIVQTQGVIQKSGVAQAQGIETPSRVKQAQATEVVPMPAPQMTVMETTTTRLGLLGRIRERRMR